MTLRLPVDPADLVSATSQASLAQAAIILRSGGTVAFPTETVYGLGANALDAQAVARIFEAKQRPAWDPLIVHIGSKDSLDAIAEVVSAADQSLIQVFWPGPLTLLLPKSDLVPAAVTSGRARVGVRMPAHAVARALIAMAGLPLAAPSANSFGRTSPTTAQHVLEDLDGRIDAVIDGGPTDLGLESTVVDANAEPPIVYRPGMISIEQLRRYLPHVVAFSETGEQAPPTGLPSPGIGLRHYAPRARLILIAVDSFQAALSAAPMNDEHIGALLPEGFTAPAHIRTFPWGQWGDPAELAQRLFAGLRALDALGVNRIFCPLPEPEGLGVALRDRLEKAAKPKA